MKSIFWLFLLISVPGFAAQDKKVRRPAASDLEIELSVFKISSMEAISNAFKEIKIVRNSRNFYPMLCFHVGFVKGAVGELLTDSNGKKIRAIVETNLPGVFDKMCTDNSKSEYEALAARLDPEKIDKLIEYFQRERLQLDQ